MFRSLLCLALFCASPAPAQDARLLSAARDMVAGLQERSFDTNREYCGLLGVIPNGLIAATRPRKGRLDSCKPREFAKDIEVVASYHTHGAYDPEVDAEVPSVQDMLADREEGIDGFVSTPGGRFWFIDGARGVARQICGVGCLDMDPQFQPEDYGPVRESYTINQLRLRENSY